LLFIILTATVATSIILSESRTQTTSKTTTVITPSIATANETRLVINLAFPNGTRFNGGDLVAGSTITKGANGSYTFTTLIPGNYSLSFQGNESVYLPPTTVHLSPGISFANLTIYRMEIYTLIETANLGYNNSQPGPLIQVPNGTAVRIVLHNNTTLIHNLAIVQTLGNVSGSNIMFASLSDTLNAGGSTNDTFFVNKVGAFYYECLIGSHARDGEYGYFIVTNNAGTASTTISTSIETRTL